MTDVLVLFWTNQMLVVVKGKTGRNECKRGQMVGAAVSRIKLDSVRCSYR